MGLWRAGSDRRRTLQNAPGSVLWGSVVNLTTVYIKCVTDRLVMFKKDVEEKEDL